MRSELTRAGLLVYVANHYIIRGALVRSRCGWQYRGSWCADMLYIASLRVWFERRNIIQQLMIYEFELKHNTTEANKTICCAKDEGAVDSSTVTRWLKKFRSGCKNLYDLTRPGRPKTENSEPVLQAIEANPMSSSRRVSGELGT